MYAFVVSASQINVQLLRINVALDDFDHTQIKQMRNGNIFEFPPSAMWRQVWQTECDAMITVKQLNLNGKRGEKVD